MTDTATPATEAPETDAPATEAPKPDTDWKAEARKWEARAKANSDAAERLAALEDAQKSAEQKIAERAERAEAELAKVRAEADRTAVALAKGLTPSQAKRLVGSTREELEADATEMLADLGASGKVTAPYVPGQQQIPDPLADESVAFVRQLFGRD